VTLPFFPFIHQNVPPKQNVPGLPCSLANLTRFPQTRHLFTIPQLTKIPPEGHNHTAFFSGKLAHEDNCQIKRQPALTFVLIIFANWQEPHCAETPQKART
jgi:hypothetical protein